MAVENIEVSCPEFYWRICLPQFQIDDEACTEEVLRERDLLSRAFHLLVAALSDREQYQQFSRHLVQSRREAVLGSAKPGAISNWQKSVFESTGLPDKIWTAASQLRNQSISYALHQVFINFKRFQKHFENSEIEALLKEFEEAHPGLKDVRDSFAHYDDRMRREGKVGGKKEKISGLLIYVAGPGGIAMTNSEGGLSTLRVGREETLHVRELLLKAFKIAGFRLMDEW